MSLVEISMLEGVGGISNLLIQAPLNRVLFGSYAPLFYFESALLKLKESPLDSRQLEMIGHKNAEQLVSGRNESKAGEMLKRQWW